MSLRRSTRAPKLKVAWKAKDAPSTALNTKISARNPQRAQKNALKSIALDPLSETVEPSENAHSNGEQDHYPLIATWEVKGAPPAAYDPKITKKTAQTAQKTAL